MYDAYATIYDAIGEARFATELTAHILAALPTPPQRALDLACGTGAVALTLARAGVTVVGVDRSRPMVQIAQARSRDLGLAVRWLIADIRQLHASPKLRSLLRPATFDLVTCCYDSLNYLSQPTELAAVCTSVAHLLRPGGRFIFDLNTIHEFATWDDTDQVVFDSPDLLVYNQLSYDAVQQIARGRIVWFIREIDRWWRGEETHAEHVWSEALIETTLTEAGLELVARHTPQWLPAPSNAPRVVYESRKKA